MRVSGATGLAMVFGVAASNGPLAVHFEYDARMSAASRQASSIDDALAVTYLCGNTFRVRNPTADEQLITWSLNGRRPLVVLRAGPRHEGQAFRDTYVDAGGVGAFVWRTRLQPRQSVSHGGVPACQPPIPPLPLSPDNEMSGAGYRDTTFTVTHPTNGTRVFRRQIAVTFRATTAPQVISRFFDDFRARVLYGRTFSAGGPLYEFGVSIPDPGPSYSALEAVMQQMDTVPGIVNVIPLSTGKSSLVPGRYP